MKQYGRAEWTISFDFMEHIQPERVDAVLESMRILAPQGKHYIDLTPESAYRGPQGENLHVSAHDAAWWDKKLTDWFGVILSYPTGAHGFLWSYDEAMAPVHALEA